MAWSRTQICLQFCVLVLYVKFVANLVKYLTISKYVKGIWSLPDCREEKCLQTEQSSKESFLCIFGFGKWSQVSSRMLIIRSGHLTPSVMSFVENNICHSHAVSLTSLEWRQTCVVSLEECSPTTLICHCSAYQRKRSELFTEGAREVSFA